MMFGFADEMKQLIIGIRIINKMKIQDVNNLSSEEFIENFNNIFEKTSFFEKNLSLTKTWLNFFLKFFFNNL